MDEVAVYDTVLSPTQVATHYAAGTSYRSVVMVDSPSRLLAAR